LFASVFPEGAVAVAKRYGRRRVDGVFEYSDSIEELDASAIREDEESLRGTFALIGLLLGAVVTYGLVGLYVPDWPKAIRFASILAGGCLSAVIFASLAVLLRRMLVIVVTMGVLGGLGYLLWRLL
jgi:hypothetical protein